MSELMREKFEFFYGLPFDECDVFMQRSWEAAWKASRETLVIELPPPAVPGGNCIRDHAIRDALEAAGLKVKP